MRMMKKYIGNSEGILDLSMPDESHGAYDSYPLLPDGFSVFCKFIKN
jgi:hypothetical protein